MATEKVIRMILPLETMLSSPRKPFLKEFTESVVRALSKLNSQQSMEIGSFCNKYQLRRFDLLSTSPTRVEMNLLLFSKVEKALIKVL